MNYSQFQSRRGADSWSCRAPHAVCWTRLHAERRSPNEEQAHVDRRDPLPWLQLQATIEPRPSPLEKAGFLKSVTGCLRFVVAVGKAGTRKT